MSKAALYRLGILNLALYRLARDRKATQQTFFLLRCFAIAQRKKISCVAFAIAQQKFFLLCCSCDRAAKKFPDAISEGFFPSLYCCRLDP